MGVANVKASVVKVDEAMADIELRAIFEDVEGCSASSISWNNPAVIAGLRKMFGARDSEVLTAVTLSSQGIQVQFRSV